MALTKLPAGSIIDGTITSVKIANATILGEDIGTGAISGDKINTTLDVSSHTITLPQDLIGHRELNITFTSPADDDKFLQISSAGVLQWAAPGTYPITYGALSGVIPSGHIADETITSTHIENLTIAEGDIADGTITAVKLNTTLDLSTKTITYPTDSSLTNLTITGNLHITGTTTEIDTQNLLVKDNIIVINDEDTGPGVTAGAAGIEINRGTGQDKATIMWNETANKFEFKLGATDAVLVFDNVEPPTSSVGYNELKINNQADPGPGVNTFLESDGTGNFNLTQIQLSGITLAGAVTGPVDNNTIANLSITRNHLQDHCITSSKIDTTLSFVGKTIILNAGDILSAINGAGYFNISNPNFNVSENCIDSAAILDGCVTGFKLANTLDLSAKTITFPPILTFQNLSTPGTITLTSSNSKIIIPDAGTIGSTSTTNAISIASNGDVTFGGNIGSASHPDAIVIDASGNVTLSQKLLISDGGNIGSASDPDAIEISATGNVTLSQNLIVGAGVVEKIGTGSVSGTTVTVDLDTGNFFVLDLETTTGDILAFTINNTNATANQLSSFVIKTIQGSTARQFNWINLTSFKWPAAIPPDLTLGNNKIDLFSFTTYDNGTTWYSATIGQDFR